MMTSVTLPSSSGPIHTGYSTIAEENAGGDADFDTPRPTKRCLASSLSDSCKKRRKQSTPVRISAAESDPQQEGKLAASSPEPELPCAVCHLVFNNQEQLKSHLATEHPGTECKKEPEDLTTTVANSDSPVASLDASGAIRPELQWMSDLQGKEWMPALPFSAANPMFMTLAPYTQPDTLPSRQPIRIFNPDAYCELCNKEFCNKYFLKTHKANKHGIYSDPPVSEQGSTVNIPSYAVNIKLPSSVPSSDISSVKNEIKPSHQFNDMFPGPFPTKFFPKLSKSNIPGFYESDSSENAYNANGLPNGESDRKTSEEHAAEESSSPRNMLFDGASYKKEPDQESVYYAAASKLSPGQQNRELDLNRLRRIGVMNPKAFCEICCKEYCNKYFLRTHKMKRHGIYIPDDREKDIKNESSQSAWSQNAQTSPLNLIMAEQSSSDRKTTSPADISCDICGIKFQNISLAQLHNVSVHSRVSSVDRDQTETNVDEQKRNSSEQQLVVNEKTLSADAISEDLQKLQTMILQLNDLNVNRSSTSCSACNKEFENRYYLHAHMMTEHGLLLDDANETEKSNETENGTNNNTLCDLCGKDVQNAEEMKKHMNEFHPSHQQNTEIKEEGFVTSERNISRAPQTEPRTSMSLTPTSSYCEICNKELCNKYFMKTHMQRMHGIEIENGAQIGGVVCDICNKELCSKYFLRVHKHNTHGIVEYGASLLQPRRSESDVPQNVPPLEPDTALKPADLADLSHRYFTHFTEVCAICSRRFRSTKWLKAHLLSDHGQAGAEKWSEVEQHLQQSMIQHVKNTGPVKSIQGDGSSPTLKIPNGGQDQPKVGIQNVLSSIFGADDNNAKTYHCSYCPFSTPLLPLLFVHERSHSVHASEGESASLKCPVCTQSFLQPELLQHHMFSQHPLIPLPPFFNGNSDGAGEVSNETAEDDGDESTNKQQGGKSKKVKRKFGQPELSPELNQILKEAVKRSHMPATYAVPQPGEEVVPGYVMQPFLIEEECGGDEQRKMVPSVVFLPVLQKQAAPITVTFTLTPA